LGTFRLRRINLRLLIALAIIAILATAAYGFAASNTVGASKAGDGSGAISGYNVTGITYTVNNADPTILDSVRFNLDGNATTVKATLDSGTTWVDCTVVGLPANNNWTCAASGATVKSVTRLRVVATQ
jgi:hypothetical protein